MGQEPAYYVVIINDASEPLEDTETRGTREQIVAMYPWMNSFIPTDSTIVFSAVLVFDTTRYTIEKL